MCINTCIYTHKSSVIYIINFEMLILITIYISSILDMRVSVYIYIYIYIYILRYKLKYIII